MAFNLNAMFDDPRFAESIALFGATGQHNAGLIDAAKTMQHMKQLKAQQEQAKLERDYKERRMTMEDKHHTANLDIASIGAVTSRINADQLRRQNDNKERELNSETEFFNILRGGMQPQSMTPPAAPGVPQPGAPALSTKAPLFNVADSFVAKIEGGYVANDAGKGPTNFGVNQTANPDVNVKALTPEAASQVRKSRYWDAIGADNLPPATAMVAYDAAINQGQDYAKRLIEQTGGNPELMLFQREKDYTALAKNPQHAPHLKGWLSRTAQLREQLKSGALSPQADPFAESRKYQDLIALAPTERTRRIAEALAKSKEAREIKPGAMYVGPDGRTTVIPDPKGDAEHLIKLSAEERALTEQRNRDAQAAREADLHESKKREQAAEEARKQAKAEEAALELRNRKAKEAAGHQTNVQTIERTQEVIKRLLDNKSLPWVTGRASVIPKKAATVINEDWGNAIADIEQVIGAMTMDTLQDMRKNAPTGASGLGQFQKFESDIMTALQGLDRMRDAESIKKSLKTVNEILDTYKRTSADVYKGTYGEDAPMPAKSEPAKPASLQYDAEKEARYQAWKKANKK